MPLIERKSKEVLSWESWQKHLNKKFGIEEPEEAKKEQAKSLIEESKKQDSEETAKDSEETVSLEFLEKPLE